MDWLENFPNPNQLDYGYADFYAGIDTVVLGRQTYETILGFGIDWPYANCTTYIVTQQATYVPTTPNTSVLSLPLRQALLALQQEAGKNIWLVGGGQLVAAVLAEGLLDELLLTVVPTVLGDGIPLWPKGTLETTFELVKAQTFETGILQLWYQRLSS